MVTEGCPFSFSSGSPPPLAAALSMTTDWRKSSLALNPGLLWSTWPCPSPFSTGCTQLLLSLRSIVRSSSSPHERGRDTGTRGLCSHLGRAGLSKHCLTKARRMPFVCLTVSGGALAPGGRAGESEQLKQLHKVVGACPWSASSSQIPNDLSSFWWRPCVSEEGGPSLRKKYGGVITCISCQ